MYISKHHLIFGCLLAFYGIASAMPGRPMDPDSLSLRPSGDMEPYKNPHDSRDLAKRSKAVAIFGLGMFLASSSVTASCGKSNTLAEWTNACIAALSAALTGFLGSVIWGFIEHAREKKKEKDKSIEDLLEQQTSAIQTSNELREQNLHAQQNNQRMMEQILFQLMLQNRGGGSGDNNGDNGDNNGDNVARSFRAHVDDGLPRLLAHRSCEDDDNDDCLPHRVWYSNNAPKKGSKSRKKRGSSSSAATMHTIHVTSSDFDYRDEDRLQRRLYDENWQKPLNSFECGDTVTVETKDGSELHGGYTWEFGSWDVMLAMEDIKWETYHAELMYKMREAHNKRGWFSKIGQYCMDLGTANTQHNATATYNGTNNAGIYGYLWADEDEESKLANDGKFLQKCRDAA